MKKPPRLVYLDTTIVSRLVNLERGVEFPSRKLQEDMAVLPRLLEVCSAREVELCASTYARVEIERLAPRRPEVRDALLWWLQRFRLLPVRQPGLDLPVGESSPLDPVVAEIEGFLLEKTQATSSRKVERVRWDARHLVVCWDSSCDVFLTTDYASLWAYRRELKRRFSLVVQRPVELWQDLGGTEPEGGPPVDR